MAIPPRFLPQVMADLVRARLVEGVTGAERRLPALAPPPPEISLLAIVEAVEGDSRRQTCVLRGGPCGRDGDLRRPRRLHQAAGGDDRRVSAAVTLPR